MATHRWRDIRAKNKTPEQIAKIEASVAAVVARKPRTARARKATKGSKAFQQIKAGLEDALAFAKGDHSRCRITMINRETGEQIRLPPGSPSPPPGWQPTARQRRIAVKPPKRRTLRIVPG